MIEGSGSVRRGMIIRQSEPVNLETPFDSVDSFVTPAELFYVRCHFAIPKLDACCYELRIDGAVRWPMTFSYDALRELPTVTVGATLECAGNSRVFLVPQAKGAQWALGAVGNAEWTGVLLSTILERAELLPDACELVFEGADSGTPNEEPVPPSPITYARSLSLTERVCPETVLAYQMNGADLRPEHGFPLRAIVPGHYGMASVKWLTHIHVSRQPFTGYWQTSDYAYWDAVDGKPVRRALGRMLVKSEIAAPAPAETIAAGQEYLVRGAAWSGEADISRVELSKDGGRTWCEGEFVDPVRKHCWRRWQCKWTVPAEPGEYTLMSRATDATGTVQPEKHDANYGSYVVNHTLPIRIFVR